MKNKARRNGVLINYVMLISSSVINIFLTPFILYSLGVFNYGLYQTINAFASNLLIADLGTGILMSRYISIYLTKNDKDGEENFVAIGLIFSAISSLVIILVGIIMYSGISTIYANTMSEIEIDTSKLIFIILIINIVVSIFDKAFIGVMNAYEKFTISKGIMLIKVLVKAILIFTLLSLGGSIVSLVLIDLTLTIIILVFSIYYVFIRLNVKARFHGFDKELLSSSFIFMVAILFSTIVSQVNYNVDKVLIGAMINTKSVSIYSIGLVIVTSYTLIANAIGSVYLPLITKKVYEGSSMKEITNIIIKPGRLNFMICGLIVSIFFLYGKEFIFLWVGDGYELSYTIALSLLFVYLIPHVQIVIGSYLDARNKRIMLSLIFFLIAGLNILLTIFLIPRFGIIGATAATMMAVIIGQWIILNSYIAKLGIQVKRMFLGIFSRTILSFALMIILSIPFAFSESSNIVEFFLKCSYSVSIFVILQFVYGFNKVEKNYMFGFLKKMKSKFIKS